MKTIEVGRVAKPHGVRGEIKVLVHWSPSDSLLAAASVWLRVEGEEAREWRVAGARRAGRFVLLQLAGVDDMDAAAALRGAAVELSRASLPEPEPGEFYLCDLIGARVLGPAGLVGHVEEIRPYPTIDVVVVRTPDGRLVEQALAPPWIDRVDVAEGCVVLSSTDGIIE